MSEVSSVTNEAESLNPIEVEQENRLTFFFRNEISRQVAELQQIDRQLTFVLNICSLIQADYSPKSEIPEELYNRLRQNMTECENAWRQAMGQPQLNPEDAINSAKERLNTLILGNRIQILSLNDLQGLNFPEKYKLVLKIQKWTCHLRFILAYIAFSARSLKPEDLQKMKAVFEKKQNGFSEAFMINALEFKVTA
jgi:hypothetical protein